MRICVSVGARVSSGTVLDQLHTAGDTVELCHHSDVTQPGLFPASCRAPRVFGGIANRSAIKGVLEYVPVFTSRGVIATTTTVRGW